MLLVQGALFVLLLVGAGLFVGGLEAAQTMDLGVDSERLMLFSAAPGDTPPGPDFRERLRERVARIPGVEQTTQVAGTIPFVSSWAGRLSVPGLPERPAV